MRVIGLAARSGTLNRLLRDTRGAMLTEFAFGLPLLLGIGFAGLEIANLSYTRMRVSQIGMAIGDNAARVGDSQGLALKKVYESDVYDTFEGARISGESIQLKQRGRVILSTLQQNAESGQWIAWQRCWGDKPWPSTYGTVGTGKTGTSFPGMGPSTARVQATPSNAVMFVEVAYNYDAIVEPFAKLLQYYGVLTDNSVITYRSAFIVRDPRQLGVSTVPATTASEDFGLFQNAVPLTRLTC